MAKAKGAEFEKRIQEFFRKIFEEMGFFVMEVRRQWAGTQNGFDVKIVFLKGADRECTLFFECKDYNSKLDWSDLFDKACELEGSNYVVDGFIVLSPRVTVSNIDDNLVPKLKSKFPFPIKYWDSNSHIEELFTLDPEVYKTVYGKECNIVNDRVSCLMKNKAIIESILEEKTLSASVKRIESDYTIEQLERSIKDSHGGPRLSLLEYVERVQRSLSDSGKRSENSFEVTVENSISISVFPVSISHNKEEVEFKTDFEAIKHYIIDNRFLIIEGEANSGKSILSKRITYFFCKEFVEGKGNFIVPVLIDLKTFDPSLRSLEELIIRELRANKVSINREDLTSYLGENNFLLILDSYDECINFESLKADIYSLPQKISIIITSRSISEIHMLKDLSPFMLKLGELTSSEQKKIAREYLKDNNEVKLFISELESQEVIGTEGNPLILKLLLLYYSKQKRLSNNIYSLYKFVMDYLLSVECSLPDGISSVNLYYEIRKNFLKNFSFHLQVNRSTSIELTAFEEFLNDWLIKKGLIEKTGLSFAIKNNLILSSFLVIKGQDISFFHRSFQDYFASEVDNSNRVNRRIFKKWFRQVYYHTSLKFYFARTQDVEFLQMFKPQKRRWFFFKGLSFTTWIENYSACLGMLDGSYVEEKERMVQLIKFLFQRFSTTETSSVFLFFHISWIAPALLSSLGYLNYRPANELFFELVKQKNKLDEYALKAIGHFKFGPSDYESFLRLATSIKKNYTEHDNLIKQIKAHSSGLGDLAIERYRITSDESEKSSLSYFLHEYFTNHSRYGVMPSKNVFEFILRIQIDTGGFGNSLRYIIHDDDEPEIQEGYNDLFYEIMYEVFQKDEPKNKKMNALDALMLTGRPDARFEVIINAGINDKDDDVVLASIIWLPYVFKDKSLESQYLNRLYAIYEKFPDNRGKILNSINRVEHDINDIERGIINRSIHGKTFSEVATALYLIKKFSLSETYPILNEFLGNEKYLFKLRCKVMETMIFLSPQLFIDGFNSEVIKDFNQKLTEERDIMAIKSIIEDTLQYIGDENTIEILQRIHDKVEEDMTDRFLKEEHRKRDLHFEYPEKSTSFNDKIILPHHVNSFADRIKLKIKHVRNFENDRK